MTHMYMERDIHSINSVTIENPNTVGKHTYCINTDVLAFIQAYIETLRSALITIKVNTVDDGS